MKITLTPKKGGKPIVFTPKKKPTMTLTKKSKPAGAKWERYAQLKSTSKRKIV
jgi:hypothetical protein